MNDQGENIGLLEAMDKKVRSLMAESRDPYFTEYLQKFQKRLIQQKYQTDLLNEELERSCRIYQQRMKVMESQAGQPVQPAAGPVQPEVQPESSAQSTSESWQEPRPAMPYFNLMDSAAAAAPERSQVRSQKNAEFTVGAAVLSIVGGGFILAALVTLGMTFGGETFKGICLYGISLLFLLVSELVLYRRWTMLGTVISAIGLGGLFLSTAVNYLGLHNLNLWAALGITLGIALITILLSRGRDCIAYRILGMIAGWLCFFLIGPGITDRDFLVASGLLLFMNVLFALLPVRKAENALNITHMAVNTVFTLSYVLYALSRCHVDIFPVMIFLISSVAVQQILLALHFIRHGRLGQPEGSHLGILIAYYISLVVYAVMSVILVQDLVIYGELEGWYCHICAIALGVIGGLAILVLVLRKCGGWQHVYSFLNAMVFCVYACSTGDWECVCCLAVMLVTVKLLALRGNLTIRINDVVITALVCLTVAVYETPQTYVLLAGICFSVLMIHYWQTCYEILLTVTLCLYAAANLPTMLQLPMVVGIILVGMLLFNYVKRWRGNYILLFNVLALVGQCICFLLLAAPIYRNAYITFLCMLVFGLATILLTLQERFELDIPGKQMVLAVFLTYMVLIFKTRLPLVNSVLLMIIALVCVGGGFIMDRKSLRIYGLVLSLFVCGKLVLYDFFKAPTIQKTILFFVVGIIALSIAAIYIVLEKRATEKEREAGAEQVRMQQTGTGQTGAEQIRTEQAQSEQTGVKW